MMPTHPKVDFCYEALVQRNYGVFSQEEQLKIRSAKIAVVGIGCDGGLAAVILTRAGLGRLTLIDFDVVEVSNLNRQPLSQVSDLGRKKVLAAKRILHDYNPFVDISAIDHRVTEDSHEVLEHHDVILQCVDNYMSRVALHRTAKRLEIPVISMTGQPPYRAFVSTFHPDGPDYEQALGLPSLGRPLSPQVEQELDNIKIERARHSDTHGATPGWSKDFIAGSRGWASDPVGWGITPERAYITGVMQAHEALRLVTGRGVLAPAPMAVVIDLLDAACLVRVKSPGKEGKWDYREF